MAIISFEFSFKKTEVIFMIKIKNTTLKYEGIYVYPAPLALMFLLMKGMTETFTFASNFAICR